MAATTTNKKTKFSNGVLEAIGSSKDNQETKDDYAKLNEEINNNANSYGKKKKSKKQNLTNFSITLPKETIEKINIAARVCYFGNRSLYIRKLIEEDLKKNLDEYRKEYNDYY